MKWTGHLSLETVELAPADEWRVQGAGWFFVRASQASGYWLGEGTLQELGAGQVLVLSPLRDGCFRASQIGPLSLHYFRFSPELAVGLLAPAEHDIFESLARAPRSAVRCFASDTPGARMWTELLSNPVQSSALSRRVELLRVAATLFAENLQQTSPEKGPFLTARLKLRLLLNQIPEAEFLKLTQRDLAAHCSVSVTHANRAFRQMFGLSLKERQRLVLLQEARQALAETAQSLEAVAAGAGYRDTPSFAAAFEKQFGVSPGEWRGLRSPQEKVRTVHEPSVCP